MNTPPPQRHIGLTRLDLVVILAVTTALGLLLLPALHQTKSKSHRIHCVNNLKQLGLSFRIQARNTVAHPLLPPQTPDAALTAFLSPSNLISDTRLLHCPADTRSTAAPTSTLTRSNLSYFINPNADERFPQTLLYGDRNLTSNNIPVPPGLIPITAQPKWSWGRDMHNQIGNIALADGSVQTITSSRLQLILLPTPGRTNWLAVP
jgi:hypothetical protein